MNVRIKLTKTASFYLQDWVIGRPRNAYSTVPGEDDTSTDTPSNPAGSAQTKAGQHRDSYRERKQRCLCVILILAFSKVEPIHAGHSHHQPFKWSLLRPQSQQVIASQVTSGAPTFTIALCKLVPRSRCWTYGAFYMCPASNPRKGYCNMPNCAYWGCETIAPTWIPGGGRDKYLKVQWGPHGCRTPQAWKKGITCKYLLLNVTNPQEDSWLLGKTWGVRYKETGKDQGGLIQIKKEIAPNDPWPERMTPRQTTRSTTPTTPHTFSSPTSSSTHPLWKLIQASYQVLNKTNPNLTEHCWLCYGVQPPYYEGVAVNDTPTQAYSDNPAQCLWETDKQSITLTEIVGSGTCVGQVPQHKRQLCVREVHYTAQAKWLVPANNTKWACSSTGLTPCISLKVFDKSSEYCVQVTIIPKIYYHPENYVYNSMTVPDHHLTKREPFTALTIAILMLAGGAGAGTGIASLVRQNKEFGALRVAIDEDIARIEESITALANSLKSLSEVVLQNRRGLDILFLQAGGLCAALKEECCVFADHTGLVTDTMAKLRERLENRKRDRESQNWFSSLFDQTPWLTTLLSSLIGPVAILFLALIFGPCILNKLVSFVENRLKTINIMLVRQRQML